MSFVQVQTLSLYYVPCINAYLVPKKVQYCPCTNIHDVDVQTLWNTYTMSL